ncbi:MAG: hypothetical protein ACREDL_16150 [Bradyrhizobium sp.]
MTSRVIAFGSGAADIRVVIPGHAKREPGISSPGLVLTRHPGKTE